MAARLELEKLTRSFAARTAIEDVSLTVEAGQVTCLLGPSGCGKSTTLRIVAGVEREDAGEVRLDGAPLTGLPPEAREVGLMFQDFALFPHLRVAENVAFGLRDRREGRARAAELLERVGLASFARAYPHELSGGEQQRVALARALAPRPRVMLMDEPFSGLDERLRDDVRDETLTLLREEGTAVLLVTHDPSEALRMADEIALMRAGRVVQKGAPRDVYARPIDRQAAAFFSDINVLSGEVRGGSVPAPWFPVPAPGVCDGARADIVIRPEHLRLGDAGEPAQVRRVRFMGASALVIVALESGEELRVLVSGQATPAEGSQVRVAADPDKLLVFAA
ncbi:MAG: ABC transporter ATP-binding protein [Pseudomonadota bacterium]